MRRTRITSLELKGITHKFENENELFKDISFQLPLGKIVAIEGPSGIGKSLLLKVITGLFTPMKGQVFYNGLALSDMSFEEFVPVRMSTSICFENGGLLMNKTLAENIRLPLLYHDQWRSERSQKLYDELVADFEMKNFLNLRPASVPVGIRKLGGVIRSILSNPQILFLDEPSLGLDARIMKTLKYWLTRFREDHGVDSTVFMACNDNELLNGLNCVRYHLEGGILKIAEGEAA